MIHEINDRLFDLDLEQYTLTFDDGLQNQFDNFDRFQKINTKKIFFIISGQVDNDPIHMTLDNVRELMQDPLVEIGSHSHAHVNLDSIASLVEKTAHIESDTKLALAWFEQTLGFLPQSFCFPFNNDLHGIYPGLLKKYGFVNFYGKERVDPDQ
jgi:peptidoglycan/xylan/chitin deacetylase (PgdA/CDA1 family)